jgi:hypothetical protein
VLEHVSGAPAHRALAGAPVAAMGEIARQLLAALAHVHRAGLVHRDVSAPNVLVSLSGGPGERPRVRLTDFGLAVPAGHAGPRGRFSGSLAYVAPETLLGLPVDGRSDLYAAGVLLYRLIVGRLPARQSGAEALVRWHLGGPPADPSIERPDTDKALGALVRALTARDPRSRPADARAALALLGAHIPKARPPGAAWRGDRARLRLALDAARLGAVRVFRLPRDAERAAACAREAAVWAQVRGVSHDRLDRAAFRQSIARLVLRWLAAGGHPLVLAARRYRLERWLPIALVGGVPIATPATVRPVACGLAASRAASAIAAFLLDPARATPAVLGFPARASDGLATALLAELERASELCDHPRAGCGGLLVVAPAEGDRGDGGGRVVSSCP